MIEHCKQMLHNNAAKWGLPADRDWNVLFHNNYQPSGSTINLLWFHRDERFPRAVTKICRDEGILVREFRSLMAVHGMTPDCVPKPMHLGSAEGFWMLWMKGVPGCRIPAHSDISSSTLIRLTDTIVSVHRGLNRGLEITAEERHRRMIIAPIELVAQCATSPAVRTGCLALRETATAAWLSRLPVIPQHGDLYLDNVLHFRNSLYIVDWENFGLIDLPFYDLLTLLLSFLRGSGGPAERWSRSQARKIPGLVERYAGGLQLGNRMPSEILPVTLVNRFYLHQSAGRSAASVMYAELEHYFEHPACWQEMFMGGA